MSIIKKQSALIHRETEKTQGTSHEATKRDHEAKQASGSIASILESAKGLMVQ